MSELLRRLAWFFRRNQFDRDLEEEMGHHLALKAEDTGGPQAANRGFGNITLIKENSRAMWTFAFWEQLSQDIRYGLRAMAANKLFTAVAALSLALGIGANTAIYSFMNAILLRSLPVQNPRELVILNWHSSGRAEVAHGINGTMYSYGKGGRSSPNFPYTVYETLRESKDVFSVLFAYASAYEMNIVARNQAEVSRGLYVSGNFYSALGVKPIVGRPILNEDDRAGGSSVAVISHALWQRRFESDPSAIGQSILINNIAFAVIGVAPPGFSGINAGFEPDFYLPLHTQPIFSRKPVEETQRRFFDPHFYWVEMMGRLQPGVSIAQAQTVFADRFHRYVESTAANAQEKQFLPELWTQAGGAGLDSLRRQYTKPLYVLMSMVALILAIACANIANLLLARATARRREIAIRLSLGAARARVIRQLLTESLLLSLTGGLLGLLVATWGIRLITWLLSDGRNDMVWRATLDWPVLAFTAGLAVLTGLVFGLAPAIQATGGPVALSLKEAKIGVRGASRVSLSHALLVSQIAISLLLVIAANLFVRTLSNLHSVNLGFNRENLLIFRLNARQGGYKDEAVGRFYAGLEDRFRQIPGVSSAAFSNFPLVAGYWTDTLVTIPGAASSPGKKPSTSTLEVNESFLEAMQIPILQGRGVEERDIASPHTVVVNQIFAAKFFPGENPVGRHISIGEPVFDAEIVGVARNSFYNSIREETPPLVYIPYTQNPQELGAVWFELRTAGNPLAITGAVRKILHQAAPHIPIASMKTQAVQIDQTISEERTFADLCACFAALALIIACVGLYGTMAYNAERRTSEVGIRMALGAQRVSILWMMLRQVVVLAAVGLAIGLFAAWQAAHFVASFLFGVKAEDPAAIWGSAAVLLAAALIAGYAPARRATRVDPMVALRNE